MQKIRAFFDARTCLLACTALLLGACSPRSKPAADETQSPASEQDVKTPDSSGKTGASDVSPAAPNAPETASPNGSASSAVSPSATPATNTVSARPEVTAKDAPLPTEEELPEAARAKVEALNQQFGKLQQERAKIQSDIQTKRFEVVQGNPALKEKSVRAEAARKEAASVLEKHADVIAAARKMEQAKERVQLARDELTAFTSGTNKVRTCPLCGNSHEVVEFEAHIRETNKAFAEERRALAEVRSRLMTSDANLVRLRAEIEQLQRELMAAQLSSAEVSALAMRQEQLSNELVALSSNRAALLRQAYADARAGKTDQNQ